MAGPRLTMAPPRPATAIGPHVPFDPRKLLPAPGLLWAYRFDREGAAELWPDDQVLRLDAGGGWIWAHFNLSDIRSQEWIEALDALPLAVRHMLVSPEDHIQLHADAACVAGVLADLVRDLKGATNEIGRLRFAVTGSFILTARRQPLHCVDTARAELGRDLRPLAPAELLRALIDRSADGFEDAVERLANDLDPIEDHVLLDVVTNERQSLSHVRHTAVRLHRPLVGLRRIVQRLEHRTADGGILGGLYGTTLVQRLEALDHDLAAVQERARVLQDEIGAKLTAETNRRVFALSILTALFVPATLVSGLFGMNVKGLPFSEAEDGFWWVFGISILTSALVSLALWRGRILRRSPS